MRILETKNEKKYIHYFTICLNNYYDNNKLRRTLQRYIIY